MTLARKILIIDDEKDMCEIMKIMLQKRGFEVVFAHDGIDGFKKAVELQPACILLDIHMPKADGLTFLRNLHAYRDEDGDRQRVIRKIPVIVMSAAGENMQSFFATEGVSDYVEKPMDAEEIKERILKVISAS